MSTSTPKQPAGDRRARGHPLGRHHRRTHRVPPQRDPAPRRRTSRDRRRRHHGLVATRQTTYRVDGPAVEYATPSPTSGTCAAGCSTSTRADSSTTCDGRPATTRWSRTSASSSPTTRTRIATRPTRSPHCSPRPPSRRLTRTPPWSPGLPRFQGFTVPSRPDQRAVPGAGDCRPLRPLPTVDAERLLAGTTVRTDGGPPSQGRRTCPTTS